MNPASIASRSVVPDDPIERFRDDVVAGLSSTPKSIPSKYFYDEKGSALFDRICELDAYYLTRAELEIMQRHAAEMAAFCGPECMIVEYGSGSSIKTEILLDHLERPAAYVPIDISEAHLHLSADRLRSRYRGLPVIPVAADYTTSFELPEVPSRPRRTVVYFPGSTIGNFEPDEAQEFLEHARSVCGPSGAILIGVDLKKDPAVLHAAYNDPEGVTAAFNLNLLVRIIRELGADFDVDQFEHRAYYDAKAGRIEMQLVSRSDQRIRVDDRFFRLRAGEPIRTEYSYKYDVEEFGALAAKTGLLTRHVWTDSLQRFSVHHLEPD
ncbi:MAG TPA: L-histidine N(alpha)-methyltransferase [Rhodothermales bacterium]